MPKRSGLGTAFYFGGVDLSGDTQSLDIAGGPAALGLTSIDQSAYFREGGLRTGSMDITEFFNPDAGAAHATLSGLPTTDVILSFVVPSSPAAIGDPAASLNAKQINYDPTRATDGSLTFKVSAQSNAYGLEWGQLLTAGKRTDTTATNGASLDTAASASFGAQLYLHVFSFTGTSVTVKLQDSADNSTFADVSGGGFTAATAAGAQRIQLGATATVRRYVRIATTGTFTNAVFVVNMNKNKTATVF